MNVEIWGNAKVNGVICGDVRAEKNLTCSKVNGNMPIVEVLVHREIEVIEIMKELNESRLVQ